MEEIFRSIVLGIIQGLTEFLPVSSSGHLEIAKVILGDERTGEASMLMTVVLHFATALSTIFVFRKDIAAIIKGIFQFKWNDETKFAGMIVASMVPAAFVGVVFKDQIEALFNGNLLLVGGALLLTGILLFLADKAKNTDKDVSWGQAIIVGIAQAIAITPGISRSGATIATSVLLGIDREKAARFSFLMVVPLIFGAIAKDIKDGAFHTGHIAVGSLSVGFIVAFITGVLACTWMIKIVKNSPLKYFAYYCLVVGAVAVGYNFLVL